MRQSSIVDITGYSCRGRNGGHSEEVDVAAEGDVVPRRVRAPSFTMACAGRDTDAFALTRAVKIHGSL